MNGFERCVGCEYENRCDGLGMCRKSYEEEIERELGLLEKDEE